MSLSFFDPWATLVETEPWAPTGSCLFIPDALSIWHLNPSELPISTSFAQAGVLQYPLFQVALSLLSSGPLLLLQGVWQVEQWMRTSVH